MIGGYSYRQNDGRDGSDGMVYIRSFIKIVSGIQKLGGGDTKITW